MVCGGREEVKMACRGREVERSHVVGGRDS